MKAKSSEQLLDPFPAYSSCVWVHGDRFLSSFVAPGRQMPFTLSASFADTLCSWTWKTTVSKGTGPLPLNARPQEELSRHKVLTDTCSVGAPRLAGTPDSGAAGPLPAEAGGPSAVDASYRHLFQQEEPGEASVLQWC